MATSSDHRNLIDQIVRVPGEVVEAVDFFSLHIDGHEIGVLRILREIESERYHIDTWKQVRMVTANDFSSQTDILSHRIEF
jgi:hypothetical protein